MPKQEITPTNVSAPQATRIRGIYPTPLTGKSQRTWLVQSELAFAAKSFLFPRT